MGTEIREESVELTLRGKAGVVALDEQMRKRSGLHEAEEAKFKPRFHAARSELRIGVTVGE